MTWAKCFSGVVRAAKSAERDVNGMHLEAVSVTNSAKKLGHEEGGRHYWGWVCGQERVILFG